MESGGKGSYELPSLDLLDPLPPVTKKVSKEDMLAQSELLQHKLLDFDIQGRVTQVYPGPVVTMFEFEPAPGVKVSRIVNLSDDLALAMKASSVRIVAPLPGKAAVGIEVPNNTRETVYFRQILETPEYQANKSRLKIPLGKDIFGQSVIASIDRMPHLLVAGATGSGKSVAINSIILALLYNARPSEVRLALVDPKMLELSMYEGIPHLLSPVVTQPKKAAETLRAIVAEMERRYRTLAEKGNKNIDSYNKAVPGGGTSPLHRGDHRRAGGPHDDGPAGGRGLDHAPRPDGQGRGHPPDRGHPAAERGRDHRPHQGEPAVKDFLPGVLQDRLAHDPRRERRGEPFRHGRHALSPPGLVPHSPGPRLLRFGSGDQDASSSSSRSRASPTSICCSRGSRKWTKRRLLP